MNSKNRALIIIIPSILILGFLASSIVNPENPSEKLTTHLRFSSSSSLINETNELDFQKLNDDEEDFRGVTVKKISNLEVIEAGLAKSRALIKEAASSAALNQTIYNPDYVPSGSLYRNPKAFHMSYLEMEKKFKVYVYEEGDRPVFHGGPCFGVLGIEGIFINNMEISRFRTKDPEKAHVFFFPMSIVSMVNYVFDVENLKRSNVKNAVIDYVNVIVQKYPYYNRSRAADHLMLACHDWAPQLSRNVPLLYKSAIRALCNANTSEGFNLTRDVSIPEIFLPHGNTDGLLGGPPPSERTLLVFFSGGIHGYIRQVLLDHWENRTEEGVKIQQYLPKGENYYDQIRKSKYCICPSGWEVASPRMVEGLYMGCVPVLIKDDYAKPFSDILKWDKFSVDIAVKDIPNIKTILMAIPQRKYLSLQKNGIKVRKHFVVNWPPKRYDVFHMMLHSIWLRRLNTHIQDLQDS